MTQPQAGSNSVTAARQYPLLSTGSRVTASGPGARPGVTVPGAGGPGAREAGSLRPPSIWNLATPYIEVRFDIDVLRSAAISKFLRYRSPTLRYRCSTLRYRSFQKTSISKCLRCRSCMLRYRVSKSKSFDIEVYVLRYRYLIFEYFDIEAP